MSVTFQVIPRLGLVYVRYEGRMDIAAAGAAVAEYQRHPHYAPGQKQLVDLAAVTEWERDFPRLLALQAAKADVFHDPAAPVLVVAHAPSATARKLADYVSRSWDGIDAVAYRVAASEADALDLLGLSQRSFLELFAGA